MRALKRTTLLAGFMGCTLLAMVSTASAAQAQALGSSAMSLNLIEPGPVSGTGPSIPNTRKFGDISYGSDKLQSIDVYAPQHVRNAPIIVMVHGGGWHSGDKTNPGVITNKGAYYTSKGFVFVSVNYPLVPTAMANQQADSVAMALAFVQANAGRWGGNAQKIVLMGHSAGAHLVALLSSNPDRVQHFGGQRWLGTVALDSAAVDIESIMRHPHRDVYDDAFGASPAYWRTTSPLATVKPSAVPYFLVCSSMRKDSCPANQELAVAAGKVGVSAQVHPEALDHGQINDQLGLPGRYTDAVDQFINSRLKGSKTSTR